VAHSDELIDSIGAFLARVSPAFGFECDDTGSSDSGGNANGNGNASVQAVAASSSFQCSSYTRLEMAQLHRRTVKVVCAHHQPNRYCSR
jgi:hypothetical protein